MFDRVYCGRSPLRRASAGAWHRWHNWHSGTHRDSLRPRTYRVSAVLCRVEHHGHQRSGISGSAWLPAACNGHPPLWHCLGPLDMSLEAKRFRPIAVPIPVFATAGSSPPISSRSGTIELRGLVPGRSRTGGGRCCPPPVTACRSGYVRQLNPLVPKRIANYWESLGSMF